MSKNVRKSVAICALMGLLVLMCGTAQANWSETFNGGEFDLTTWEFYCYPDLTKTFTHTIQDGPDDNDYLAIGETTSVGAGGSAFGAGFGSDEVFTDVRIGAVVNVVGDASRNYYALVGRADYIIIPPPPNPPVYPGVVADCYVLLINWEDGPANLTIELQKVVQLSNIMDIDYEVAVPGLDHARSYYAELDIVGSDPVYITGSLYEYKGGPLVARVPTLIDTNAKDPWEDPGEHDAVFTSGASGISGFNEDPEPAGYYTTFDDVFSISDGPGAVNPSPADGATGVSVVTDLSWLEAAFATGRELWFGKEGAMQKVEPAPGSASYDPGVLEFGQTYQWRVDEVGPSGTVTGRTWTFTTGPCVAVDDFESYVDDADIESKWPHNIPAGATGPYHYIFLLTQGTQQGAKAMRFECQNQYEPFFTEATHTFATAQDWTRDGVKALSLFFAGYWTGDEQNVEQPMYVKLEDMAGKTGKVVHPYTHAVQSQSWRQWSIALAEFGDINLTAIRKITIGVGDGTKSEQEVKDRDYVFVDNIRLCPPRCFNVGQVDLSGDANGDCVVDLKDLAVMADGWLNSGLSAAP